MDPDLRQHYEADVRALARTAQRLRAAGIAPEAIARRLNGERRELSARYKALTPEPLRARIAARSLAVYGDPDGPTIEGLRAGGKDWDQIIDAAARPGRFPPF